jgi:DnaK suppressor protein
MFRGLAATAQYAIAEAGMTKRDQKKRPAIKAGKKLSPRSKAGRAKAAASTKAPAKKAVASGAKASNASKKPAKPVRASALRTKVAPAKRAPISKAANEPVKRAQNKVAATVKSSTIVLAPDYMPSENEPFMNEKHRMYFRQKLLNWKEDIIRQTRETLVGLHDDSTQHADIADRATSETDRALELRSRDRQRKLISKIDAALARIEDGSYGYCEETGEPIGLKRLDARPIATLSLEAQERHERRERVYRED